MMPAQDRLGFAVVLICIAIAFSGAEALAADLPQDFVYLRDVDPTIVQDMRYAGSNNFTGAPVPGYDAPECVVLRPAAEALKKVQADLRPKNVTLKVYDCYRPARAVASFVAWAKKPDVPSAKLVHYPNLPKAVLFPDYIATRSGHSRGATVDLTLVPIAAAQSSVQAESAAPQSCTVPQEGLAPDGSLAMGTSFDCFDVKANTQATGLTGEECENRAMLVDAMQARGFKNYPKEWWHYTFEPEPFPETYFDFPIEPRANDGGQ